MELVSIIIPVFNAKERLEICVNSLCNQTYDNLEIILVDDGSKDGSDYICDSLMEKDSRIHVFHKENGGVSSARNLGLEKSTGKYIVFVDADDYLSKNGIKKMYDFITKSNCQIAIAGKYIDYYGKKVEYLPIKYYKKLYTKDEVANELLYLNQSSNFDVLWNKMYNADFLKNNNIQFELYATTSQDLIFNVDCFMKYPKVCLIDDAYYYYYKGRQETIVSRYHNNMIHIMKERNKCLKKLFSFYDINYVEAEHWLKTAYIKTMYNCLINVYRNGSPKKLKNRITIIKSLYTDKELSMYLKEKLNLPFFEKIFKFFYNKKMTLCMYFTFHIFYSVNQIKKRLLYGG